MLTNLIHNRIIIITPERLGDTLMCTPAIHYLKHYYPSLEIDVITLSELSAEILKNNPDIHRIFTLPSQKMLKLWKNHYDRVLNIHDNPLARDYIHALNIPAEHIPPENPHLHQAEQALRFVQSLLPGAPEILDRRYKIISHAHDNAYILDLFKKHSVDFKKDILIGLHAGCHSLAKKRFAFLKKMTHPKIWPFESLAMLAQKIYEENPHIKIILTGSRSEEVLGKKLMKRVPNMINLINQTTVCQLYVLMKYLNVFISPDTGLMHVACSADVPLIALFGPTQLRRTGPYPTLSDLTVIQAPTMAEIMAEKVFSTLMQKISLKVKDLNFYE